MNAKDTWHLRCISKSETGYSDRNKGFVWLILLLCGHLVLVRLTEMSSQVENLLKNKQFLYNKKH